MNQLNLFTESESEKLHNLAALMEAMLEGRGWITSEQLLYDMDMTVCEANKRLIRDAVFFSQGRIASGPGTPGYALTRQLTPEQIGIIDGLKTQAVAMLRRRTQILRCWHSATKPKTQTA